MYFVILASGLKGHPKWLQRFICSLALFGYSVPRGNLYLARICPHPQACSPDVAIFAFKNRSPCCAVIRRRQRLRLPAKLQNPLPNTIKPQFDLSFRNSSRAKSSLKSFRRRADMRKSLSAAGQSKLHRARQEKERHYVKNLKWRASRR
jgi:hypothetical protein